MVRAHLREMDASHLGEVAGKLSFWGCLVEDCDFSGSDLGNVLLSGAVDDPSARTVFRRCRFDRALLVHAGLNHTRFEACTFEHTNLDRVQFHQNDLVDNVFVGPVSEITLWGLAPHAKRDPSIQPNEIHGNDFTGADISGLGLANGVQIFEQRWPDDPQVVCVGDVPARAPRHATARPGTTRITTDPHPARRLRLRRAAAGWVFFLNDPLWSEEKRRAVRLLMPSD